MFSQFIYIRGPIPWQQKTMSNTNLHLSYYKLIDFSTTYTGTVVQARIRIHWLLILDPWICIQCRIREFRSGSVPDLSKTLWYQYLNLRSAGSMHVPGIYGEQNILRIFFFVHQEVLQARAIEAGEEFSSLGAGQLSTPQVLRAT